MNNKSSTNRMKRRTPPKDYKVLSGKELDKIDFNRMSIIDVVGSPDGFDESLNQVMWGNNQNLEIEKNLFDEQNLTEIILEWDYEETYKLVVKSDFQDIVEHIHGKVLHEFSDAGIEHNAIDFENVNKLYTELRSHIPDETKEPIIKGGKYILRTQLAHLTVITAYFPSMKLLKSSELEQFREVRDVINDLFRLRMLGDGNWNSIYFWGRARQRLVKFIRSHDSVTNPRMFELPVRILKRILPDEAIQKIMIKVFMHFNMLQTILPPTKASQKRLIPPDGRLKSFISQTEPISNKELLGRWTKRIIR